MTPDYILEYSQKESDTNLDYVEFFKDIENREFIIESSMFKIHDLFIENCRRYGFQPNIIFQTSGYSLCHKLCKQGRGISLTLEKNCKHMLDDELVSVPFDEEFKWRIYVITKKGKQIETYVNRFVEYTKSWRIL